MQEIVYHTQFVQEDTYWWFVARNKIVKELIKLYCSDLKGKTVLDVGCGTGGFSKLLIDDYNVLCLDTSEIALNYCRQRNLNNLFLGTLDEFNPTNSKISATLFLDVIEHIDDDKAVIKRAYQILEKGGYLIATVPAYQWLWSNHDVIHMHKRRYTKKTFNNLLQDAGFNLIFSSYFNSFLFFPAIIKRFYDNIMKTDKTSNNPEAEVIDPVSPFINKLFLKIFSFERNILSRMTLPFGLSIFTIAKKI
ncbi:MAG: class I SAM-dependent methyltransferase [Candidatus Kapabacteria bacterium]|nr:class I SAM-dependent methyltransferase [Candidatus Kapabacteria bacterium]